MHGDGQRRLAAAGAGDLARQLVVPGAPGRQAGQRVRERERADARAQLLALDRDRGLRGQHAEHLGDRVGHGVDRVAPDQDQHAGDLVAAQHGLEQRRARPGRLHQRRRERRVGAGVGHEVGLARGEGAAAVLGLGPRLDRHRRDVDADHRGRDELAAGGLEHEGDGRRGDLAGGAADGGPGVAAAGQRARHAAEGGEPAGVLAQGLGHPLQVARRALALELGGEDAGEHREQLLVALAEARRGARQRGEAADPRAVRELERDAEVGDRGEPALLVEAGVDRVAGDVVAAARAGVLGHLAAEGVAQRGRLVGLQAEGSRRRGCRRSGGRCGRDRGARGTASCRAAAARAGRGRNGSRPRTSGRRPSSR